MVAEATGKLVFGHDRVLISNRGSKSIVKAGRQAREALFEYQAGALVPAAFMSIFRSFVSMG